MKSLTMGRLFVQLLLSACAVAQSSQYSVLCNIVRTTHARPQDAKAATEDIPNVHATVAGRMVQDLSVSKATGPRRIFILQDRSGSFKHGNADRLSWQVVKYFVASSPASDQLALVDFNDQAYLDISVRKAELFAAGLDDPQLAKKTKPRGGTAAFDAVASASDYLRSAPQEGDSIFLITDGGDNASRVSAADLRNHLLGSGVRIFVLVLEDSLLPPAEKKGQRELTRIAEENGGYAAHLVPANRAMLEFRPGGPFEPMYDLGAKGLEHIRSIVEDMHALIETPYRVSFSLNTPVQLPAPLKVWIDPKGSSEAEDVGILFPQLLGGNAIVKSQK